MPTTFEPADAGRDRAVLTELNVAYLDWLDASIQQTFGLDLPALLNQPIVEYVEATLGALCAAEPPEGVFYLVRRDGAAVGMGGVRRTTDEAAEMKRVFVRPSQRGTGLGADIVRRLVSDARSFGYTSMRLDSGPFMTAAHRLYEAEGFRDRPIYAGAEVPSELHHDWRFMELDLRSP
ncbi:acetyltransferase (GNAT) family protein [Ilumatobacter fluminis]|uniref:Acetyltransferase (GNAT) family protein n=1 Tax=Ilumatobacter fluminis TaxID=467091 RepID=A0A4R7I0P3_9ACTN|nr:GNAT family N-acetyltransferase [Ilumatobacter fluminis]TDT16975.1 acetyltransferase (GNAT) family protein [Ilumatobacter fluminis]